MCKGPDARGNVQHVPEVENQRESSRSSRAFVRTLDFVLSELEVIGGLEWGIGCKRTTILLHDAQITGKPVTNFPVNYTRDNYGELGQGGIHVCGQTWCNFAYILFLCFVSSCSGGKNIQTFFSSRQHEQVELEGFLNGVYIHKVLLA